MTVADLGADDFLAGLQRLLPRGLAWPRDPEARLTDLLAGLATTQARQHARTGDLSERESDPAQALELLSDWEAAYGLPDPCLPLNATIEQRRAALLARIAARGGQSIAYFTEVAAALGYDILVEEFRPFRVGAGRVGTPIYGQDWASAWRIRTAASTIAAFRLRRSAVGEPLRSWGNDHLECVMRRLKPAHTTLLFATFQGVWDFTAGRPAGATRARDSAATHIDATGTLAEDVVDTARLDFDPVGPVNAIRNPLLAGGAAGAPGTAPTAVEIFSGSGITHEIVGFGTDTVPYMRVRFSGTATAAVSLVVRFGNGTDGTAPEGRAGDQWTYGLFCRRVAGSFTGLAGVPRLAVFEWDAAGTALTSALTALPVQDGGDLTSALGAVTRTLTEAATRRHGPQFRLPILPGEVVDFTIDLALPTATRGAVALPNLVPLATLLAGQAGLRGMLVESAGTNLNTNPRAEGATPGIIGAGGVMPTDWSAVVAATMTREVVGVTTIGGVTGLLLRIYGTPSATTVQTLRVGGQVTTVPAGTIVANQAWIGLFSGTLTNTTGWIFRCANEATGALSFTPGAITRRFCVQTTTSTAASTLLRWAYSDTVTPVDFTLFIGFPDRKHGSPLVTAPVLPPIGTPGEAAGAEDALRLDLPDGTYDATVLAGTLAASGTEYAQQLTAVAGRGGAFAWPAAALAAGERHLRKLSLRKVA